MKTVLIAVIGGSVIAATALTTSMRPAFASAPAVEAAQAAAYSVDAVHSAANYRIKHQNVAYNWGRFNKMAGTFMFDEADPSKSVLDITIDAASIDSANAKRDEHLRSPDFFSTKEFPSITFKSKSVSKGDTTGKYVVKGDLTLRGQTKSIEVVVEDTGRGEGRGGSKVAGIESTFTIKRSDYGMTYMVGPLSDEVTLTVSLEGEMK